MGSVVRGSVVWGIWHAGFTAIASRQGLGVRELRRDFDPGFRMYCAEKGGELVILLAGGDKSSQRRDVEQAIMLADNLLGAIREREIDPLEHR